MHPEEHNKIPLILSGIAVFGAFLVLAYSVYQIMVEPSVPKDATVIQKIDAKAKTISPTAKPTVTLEEEIQQALDDLDKEATEEAVPELE